MRQTIWPCSTISPLASMPHLLGKVWNSGLLSTFIFGRLQDLNGRIIDLIVSYRCLAHVINLATQALITGYSKTKFFDPAQPEAHNPDSLEESERDVIGLVRAITVKVLNRHISYCFLWSSLDVHDRFNLLQNGRRNSSHCRVHPTSEFFFLTWKSAGHLHLQC